MIDNTGVLDESLSWRAKGLLWYALSKPEDWQIKMADLVKRSTDGRDSTRSAFTELEAKKYAIRVRSHDENGLFCWTTIVFDSPEGFDEWAQTEEGKTLLSTKGNQKARTVNGSTIDGQPVNGQTIDGQPEVIYINDSTNIESTNIEKQKEGADDFFVNSFSASNEEDSQPKQEIQNQETPTPPNPSSPSAPENLPTTVYYDRMAERFADKGGSRQSQTKPWLKDDDFLRYLFAELRKTKSYFRDLPDKNDLKPVKEYIQRSWLLGAEGEMRFAAVQEYVKDYEEYKAAEAIAAQRPTQQAQPHLQIVEERVLMTKDEQAALYQKALELKRQRQMAQANLTA